MQYNIILTSQELEIVAKVLQEGPYRIVAPILENIGKQVDIQNTPQPKKEETETPKE